MKQFCLLALSILFLTGCATGPEIEVEDEFPKGVLIHHPVAPTFQAIDLKLDPDRADYTGTAKINLRVDEPVSSFQFHALEMDLPQVILNDGTNSISVSVETEEDGLVTAALEREVVPGEYTLSIDFSSEFGNRAVGLYRMEQDGSSYLFTQMEPTDARRAFPCWDEPFFKIPFQMTLTIPSGMEAVTNAPLDSKSEEGDWRKLTFVKTKPISTYLLALAVGPLESAPITGLSVPGRIYVPRGQIHLSQLATEMTPRILKSMEEYFGRPYPYDKLDFVAVPEYWPGAMENPGLVTFADQILLVDATVASVAQRRRLAVVIAHELAHMWFGDLVTLRWWDDLWLNESFASWMGDKITHQIFPGYRVDMANLQRVQSLMDNDARPSIKPIRRPVVSTAEIMEDLGLAFWKGQAVLGMFEQWVGPEVFQKGVVQYINAHAWGNAEAADLWNALSEASGKNLTEALASFLEQPGYPLIEVEETSEGFTLSQRRFLNEGVSAPNVEWKLPLRIKYSDGEANHTRELLLEGTRMSLALGPAVTWILPDAGAHGYYRWRIPSRMFLNLAEVAEDAMTPRERVGFLGNASALLDAGGLGGDEYLRLLNTFADDPDPIVISTLVSSLTKVQQAFVPDDLLPAFSVYVRRTLRPALDRFGLEPGPDEEESVALFRPALLGKLGIEGQDPEARAYAAYVARAYMAGSDSVDASVIGTALRVSAVEGDQLLFESYRQQFENAKSPARRLRFLSSLGAFTDSEIQKAALRYALEGPVRPTDLFRVVGSLPDTEAAQESVWRWFMENYEAVASRIPPDFLPYAASLAGGCSRVRLEEAKSFFASPEHQVEGTASQLAKVSDQVSDCLRLRQREGGAVATYLRELQEVQSGPASSDEGDDRG